MKTTEKVNNEMMSNEEVLEAKKDLNQGFSDEDLKDVAGGSIPLPLHGKYEKVKRCMEP